MGRGRSGGVARVASRTKFRLKAPDLQNVPLDRWLRTILEEDRASRDVTTRALVPPEARAVGIVEAQAAGVLSGVGVAQRLARSCGIRAARIREDGERVRRGQPVLLLTGRARDLLAVERTLLNLVMHLSGVATATAATVAAAHRVSPRFVVAATRKTLPGLRDLEKMAVVHGGGDPHRRDLASAFLVKNNHLELVPLDEAVRRVRRASRGLPLIVEVRRFEEARTAARAGVGRLLVDNQSPASVARWVRGLEREGLRHGVVIEVSGGIDASNVAAYARAGADVASVGALTHSARALPFHLVIHPSPDPEEGGVRRRTHPS